MLNVKMIRFSQHRSIESKEVNGVITDLIPGETITNLVLELPNGDAFSAQVSTDDFDKKIQPALKNRI